MDKKLVKIIIFFMICSVTLMIPDYSYASNFKQGEGYQEGLYDKTAILPTVDNWNKQSRFNGPAKQPQVKWKIKSSPSLYSYFDSGLVIAKDGTIYSGNTVGQLVAVTPGGKIKWIFDLSEDIEIRSNPVIGKDGTIYFTATNWSTNVKIPYFCQKKKCVKTVLFALTPGGKVKWSTKFKEINKFGSPAIDSEGNIHFGTGGGMTTGTYYKVSPTRKLLYSYKYINEEVDTTPTITRSNFIFVQNHYFSGTNYLKDGYNGGAITTFSTPVVDENENFYFGTYSGALGFVSKDGQFNWQLVLDPTYIQGNDYSISLSGPRISVTPALGKNGRIYLGTEEGTVYGLQTNELTNFREVFSSEHTTMYVYEQKKAQKSWTYKTDGWVSAIVTGMDGTIYIGTKKGTIYALNANGHVLWKKHIGGENLYDIAIGENKTLFVLIDKQIVALK